MNNQNAPTVTIIPAVTGDGLIRLDIKIANAPADLLGAAFHLKISGNDLRLERYESGNFFSLNDEKPLLLVAGKNGSKGNEIIAGISKTILQNGNFTDGTLMTLYLKGARTDAVEFKFSDTHLSIWDGARRDLNNVIWNDNKLEFSRAGAESVSTQLQTNVMNKENPPGTASIIQLYEFLLVVFVAILIGCLVYYFWVRWRYFDDDFKKS